MVREDGSIVRRAEVKGIEFRVVSTSAGKSRSVWDAIDCIRNEKSKKDKTETRKKWYDIFSNKKWTPLAEEEARLKAR